MMRVWDAELLAECGAHPVTDGLLFWLDGQDTLFGDTEYSAYTPPIYSVSHMFDRVCGARVDFARLSNSYSGGMQHMAPCLYTAAPYGGGGQIGTVAEIANVRTVELTFGVAKSGYLAANEKVNGGERVFFPIRSSSDGAKIESANAIYDRSVHLVFQGDCTTGKPVIYQNGMIASVTGSSAVQVQAFTVKDLIHLPQNTMLGSIRLYNRSLSPEEIQHNIAYEIGLGRLTI